MAGQTTVRRWASGLATSSGCQLANHLGKGLGADQVWPLSVLYEEARWLATVIPSSPSTQVATMREPSVAVARSARFAGRRLVDTAAADDQFAPPSVEVAARNRAVPSSHATVTTWPSADEVMLGCEA